MLDGELKQQLQAYLQRIDQPVRIRAALDGSAGSREMLELLREICALSGQLSLTEHYDEPERTPSFSLSGATTAGGVRFAGIPLGHEFTSLVLALLQVGGYPAKVEAALLEQIRALPGELNFETFISLTCQNCPDVVQALNLMAITNPRIRHVMIDGALFQQEVSERKIMAVPSVYLNGQPFGQGRMSLEEIVAKLDTGSAERQAAELDAREPYDVLVVGGGPAGAAAAIYAARKGIRTGLLAERFGGQVLDTLGIENFISVKETEGPQLAAALEEHVRGYEVDIMNLQRAASLVPGELLQVKLASGATLKSRSVILATGARWREMQVPGEREYRGRGVAYCPHCDGPLFKGKRVAVIGGGNSGVEAAIDLAGIVSQVTLLEFDGKLRADEVLQRKLRSLGNVRVLTSAQSTEVHGADGKVNALSYRDRLTNEPHRIELEGVFVQIGLLPNTDWLKGTVALSKRGEVEVDARGQTSVPGVFAAGDVTTAPYKQIIVAMGEGAKASLAAFDHLIRSGAPEVAASAA
ncbi:MAG TPA: alkyl hydroperoxide reductase subunit F [Steroidobacteraceae bacterium]|nr:alkyl hydroperoxide reductase subunit F [Steroidobacteraceae bacterium]